MYGSPETPEKVQVGRHRCGLTVVLSQPAVQLAVTVAGGCVVVVVLVDVVVVEVVGTVVVVLVVGGDRAV